MQSVGVEGLGCPTKRWQAGVWAEGLKHRQEGMSVTKGGHSQLGWTSSEVALCHFTHIVENFRSCRSPLISIHFAKMSTEAVLNPPHQAVRRHKAEHGQSDSLAKGLDVKVVSKG